MNRQAGRTLAELRGNPSQRAADRFLNRLQSTDPKAYKIVMSHIPGNTGMGAMGSVWDGITDGLNSLFNSDFVQTGAQYYINREEQERAAKAAKTQAEMELARERQLLEQERLRQQSEMMRAQLEQQLAELANERYKIELTGKQKNMLYLAGGLTALLAFMIYNRKKGR